MPYAPSEFQSALGGLDASKEKASISEAERLSALRAYGLEKPAMKPQADMLAGVSLLPTGGAAGSSPAPQGGESVAAPSPTQQAPRPQARQAKKGVTQDKLAEIASRLYGKAMFRTRETPFGVPDYLNDEDRLNFLSGNEDTRGSVVGHPHLPKGYLQAIDELSAGEDKSFMGFPVNKLDKEEKYLLRLLMQQGMKEQQERFKQLDAEDAAKAKAAGK